MDNNRLLLALEKAIKDINREIINPAFEDLALEGLDPVINLTARARADYLKELFAIAQEFPDSQPSEERINGLRNLRLCYQELVSASQALETAIERNYLDVIAQ